MNDTADAPVRVCTLTHAEHLATWKSWRDDCEACGFGMRDVDQCDRGHPDDGVTWCGACGHDAEYNRLGVGELGAILAKASTAGVDASGWDIATAVRACPPLTLDERRALYRRLLTEHNEARARRGLEPSGHLRSWQKRCRRCEEWLPVERTIERLPLLCDGCRA